MTGRGSTQMNADLLFSSSTLQSGIEVEERERKSASIRVDPRPVSLENGGRLGAALRGERRAFALDRPR
jgi:hypothetical protein